MTPLEALGVFWSRQVNINELPATDPTVALGRTCETIFTAGVDTLRSTFPNPRVRALAAVVWDLVGHKQVLVAIGPDVPTLSFTVMRQGSTYQGIVLIPKHWPELAQADPFMQLGAILYVGVQIVDFYNDRLIGDATSRPRWNAYEAEFLRTLRQQAPAWVPNAQQQAVMAKYPEGLDSAGVDLYPFKGYEAPRGSA